MTPAAGMVGYVTMAGDLGAGEGPAVDWAVLRELADAVGDPTLAEDVAAAYRAELPRRLAALGRSLDGPLTALADAAHTLKASSTSVGAIRLGHLCRQVELAARSGDDRTARTAARQALGEAERVRVAFDQGSNL